MDIILIIKEEDLEIIPYFLELSYQKMEDTKIHSINFIVVVIIKVIIIFDRKELSFQATKDIDDLFFICKGQPIPHQNYCFQSYITPIALHFFINFLPFWEESCCYFISNVLNKKIKLLN